MENDILWQASPARWQESSLHKFATETNAQHHAAPEDYAALLAWSITNPDAFNTALWDFFDIIGTHGDRVFQPGKTLRDAEFFPDASICYAENLLRDADDRLAIIAHRDDGTRRTITRADLKAMVARIVLALRAEGVVPGDRIGGIVTNDIEAIACYLAVNAVGAIWSSCSPDFGPAGASDRLGQIAPKLLLAVPSYGYAGKIVETTPAINAVAAEPSITKIILLTTPPDSVAYDKPSTTLDAWLAPHEAGEIDWHRRPFNAPMAILFSSGTTGKPKCIVHGAGGLLLQHLKEQALQCDIKSGDRFFYFTTCGWMMWNWQVSGLALGATLVTFDGNPLYPKPSRLLDLADSEQINIFGTSAKYIDACAKFGVTPRETHTLSTVRTILSTGSPLLPESFDYIYRDWKADVHLASISGGTDICACFVGGVPALPVRCGEIQGAMLGMDVDAVDDEGKSVTGAPGEFVCRNAHLTMPIMFWDDPDGSRYQDAYFSRFDTVWAQGDFIERRPSGGYIIHGRSDTTLNPGGVRIGTAEIYRQVETVDQVEEAIVIGQNWKGDQRVVLFVRLREGAALTDDLRALIKTRIRSGATPRHVPAKIVAVTEIPRTRSGKISEIAVRDSVHARPIKNTTALANPDSLDFYRAWGETEGKA